MTLSLSLVYDLMILLKGAAAAIALRLTGLPAQQALGMGIGLAHVGEFAFVLVLLGVNSGVLSEADDPRVVAIAVGSLVLTPTRMQFGLKLQDCSAEETLDERIPHQEIEKHQAIVIGAGPIGRSIGSQLETLVTTCAWSTSVRSTFIHSLNKDFERWLGTRASESMLESARGEGGELVVVCVPDDGAATRIVKAARRMNSDCRIVVRCRYQATSMN